MWRAAVGGGFEYFGKEEAPGGAVCWGEAWAEVTPEAQKAARYVLENPQDGGDRATICLSEARCKDFDGFLFVNLDDDAAGMDEGFAGAREELTERVPQIGGAGTAGPGNVQNTCHWRACDVDHCTVWRGWHTVGSVKSEGIRRLARQDRETTVQEDIRRVESVHRELKSRGCRPGPLVLDPGCGVMSEHSIAMQQGWMREAVEARAGKIRRNNLGRTFRKFLAFGRGGGTMPGMEETVMERYALYYHPIPFRGHVIRYVLAHAGQGWIEPDHDAVLALKSRPVAAQPYPFMAPPVLHDRRDDLWLSQMPAIAMHLGRAHGLSRDADLELRLLCDANDILFEITRGHGALMWDRANWAAFAGERLPRWMRIHAALLPETAGEPGLAELVLSALWHTMVDRLPPLRPVLHANAPELERRVDAVAASPASAAMLGHWAGRQPLYCGGQIEASLLQMLNMEEPA